MKRFWILTSIAVTSIILLVGVVLFNNYNKNKAVTKDKTTVTQMASNFSLAWFNYTKQTDSGYMNKIRPFMTTEFYDATLYLNTNRPQDFADQVPMTAKLLSVEIKDYSANNSTVTVSLETKESGSSKITTTILVNLVKSNGGWLVSSFE